MGLKHTVPIIAFLLVSSIAARADWEYGEELDVAVGWVTAGGYELMVACDETGQSVHYVLPTPIPRSTADMLDKRDLWLFISIDGQEFIVGAIAMHDEGNDLEFAGDLSSGLMNALIAARRTIDVSVVMSDPDERGWSQAFSSKGSTSVLRRVLTACDDG